MHHVENLFDPFWNLQQFAVNSKSWNPLSANVSVAVCGSNIRTHHGWQESWAIFLGLRLPEFVRVVLSTIESKWLSSRIDHTTWKPRIFTSLWTWCFTLWAAWMFFFFLKTLENNIIEAQENRKPRCKPSGTKTTKRHSWTLRRLSGWPSWATSSSESLVPCGMRVACWTWHWRRWEGDGDKSILGFSRGVFKCLWYFSRAFVFLWYLSKVFYTLWVNVARPN